MDRTGEEEYIFTITEDQAGMRADRFLAGELSDHTRSYIQKLIREGRLLVEGTPAKASYRLRVDEQVSLRIPPLKELSVLPEEMDLDIVYEDRDILIINKGKDMVVHPCPGRYSGTLVNGLLAHCADELSGINGVLRPGIVHRIDKDTTGLLVVCKNDAAHKSLAAQLKDHTITRRYKAIVWNNFNLESGTVDSPIGRSSTDRKKMAAGVAKGRRAVTHYRVLDHLDRRFNLIECRLETGRTHQIRVHMASIGHPLLGDTVYGPSRTPSGLPSGQGQFLHAGTLGFIHPGTGDYVEFHAPLPAYFEETLRRLGADSQ